MKEDFLHYVWKHKMFVPSVLQTTSKEALQIVSSGTHNFDSGPDFFNAKLHIGEQLWAGNVEIHLKSSDWYMHGHEENEKYDSVILHVVWEHDVDVFRRDNSAIAILELKRYVSKKMLENYTKLFLGKREWLFCEKSLADTNKFVLSNWMDRLYLERLEQKSILIGTLLEKSANDWEVVLFKLLTKNFGLKVNGDAFLNLANSLSFSVLRKESFDRKSVEALLFGQAGFFEKEEEDVYFLALQKEYAYLRKKHALHPIFNAQFSFFRLRPANFPTLRLSQLASLYHKEQNLFSQLVEVKKIEDFYQLLSVRTSAYWETHYVFGKQSPKREKKLSKSFLDLLLINTILPLRFAYLKHIGRFEEAKFMAFSERIKPEKNAIINRFSQWNINAKNALDTQSLLQLKQEYCSKKRCLECAVGNALLQEK